MVGDGLTGALYTYGIEERNRNMYNRNLELIFSQTKREKQEEEE